MEDILVARVKPKCESEMSNDVFFLYYEYCCTCNRVGYRCVVEGWAYVDGCVRMCARVCVFALGIVYRSHKRACMRAWWRDGRVLVAVCVCLRACVRGGGMDARMCVRVSLSVRVIVYDMCVCIFRSDHWWIGVCSNYS